MGRLPRRVALESGSNCRANLWNSVLLTTVTAQNHIRDSISRITFPVAIWSTAKA
jgi:hypothetical protein